MAGVVVLATFDAAGDHALRGPVGGHHAVERLFEAEHERQRDRAREAALPEGVSEEDERKAIRARGVEVHQEDGATRTRDRAADRGEELELLDVFLVQWAAEVGARLEIGDARRRPNAVEIARAVAAADLHRAKVSGEGDELAADRAVTAGQRGEDAACREDAGTLVPVDATDRDERRPREIADDAANLSRTWGISFSRVVVEPDASLTAYASANALTRGPSYSAIPRSPLHVGSRSALRAGRQRSP